MIQIMMMAAGLDQRKAKSLMMASNLSLATMSKKMLSMLVLEFVQELVFAEAPLVLWDSVE